jgi:hypothetical protein
MYSDASKLFTCLSIQFLMVEARDDRTPAPAHNTPDRANPLVAASGTGRYVTRIEAIRRT